MGDAVAATIKTGSPVTGDDFFGRKTEVERFWKAIDGGQNLLLVSPRRVGKTSLMRHVESNPRNGWFPVFANLEGKTSAAGVITEIISRLENRGGLGVKIASGFLKALGSVEVAGFGVSATIRTAAQKDWEHLAGEFEKAIASATTKKEKLILILDEFPIVIEKLLNNPATREEGVSLLQLFRKIRTNVVVGDRFRMVVGGSIGLKPVLRKHKATADANDLSAFRIGPWTKTSAVSFMDEIAETYDFDLPKERRADVLKCTGEEPIPYHLQTLLDRLVNSGISAKDVTSQDIEDFWIGALGDLDLDHYRERLGSVLEVAEAAAATEMLDLIAFKGHQLREALVGDGDDRRTRVNALRVLTDDGYLVERRDEDGERRLRFSNPMLEEFWRRF